MRKLATSLWLAFALVAALITAPTLYAQDGQARSGTMMGPGMMDDESANNDGGMMGMIKMMKGMSRMINHCNSAMSDTRPNDQWRKNTPSESERNG